MLVTNNIWQVSCLEMPYAGSYRLMFKQMLNHIFKGFFPSWEKAFDTYYHTTSQLCVHALCMHALTCACIDYQYYCISIDNTKALADGDGFQYSSSSASSDDYAS